MITLLLNHRSAAGNYLLIERLSALSEEQATGLAEQRAQRDPTTMWSSCAIVHTNGSVTHGERHGSQVIWGVS
jgi:hypothetical protein